MTITGERFVEYVSNLNISVSVCQNLMRQTATYCGTTVPQEFISMGGR